MPDIFKYNPIHLFEYQEKSKKNWKQLIIKILQCDAIHNQNYSKTLIWIDKIKSD